MSSQLEEENVLPCQEHPADYRGSVAEKSRGFNSQRAPHCNAVAEGLGAELRAADGDERSLVGGQQVIGH